MINILARVREHLDTIAVLFLAILFSALGFIHLASGEALANGILATLAVLSFSFIRERLRREIAEQALNANLSALQFGLRDFPEQLGRIGDVSRHVEALRTELNGSAEMQKLAEPAIADTFAEARRDARQWMYRGGTGTYLRSVTLPALAAATRTSGRLIFLNIQVIDPRNDKLCADYARHRYSADVWPDSESPWTRELVRDAVYATILAACWHRQHFGMLRIRLGVVPTWSSFRYDMAPSCLMITVRDREMPAYRVPAGKLLYEYWETELRISADQAEGVALDQAPALSWVPTCDEALGVLAALGMPLNRTDDESVQAIIDKALYRGATPYDSAA